MLSPENVDILMIGAYTGRIDDSHALRLYLASVSEWIIELQVKYDIEPL